MIEQINKHSRIRGHVRDIARCVLCPFLVVLLWSDPMTTACGECLQAQAGGAKIGEQWADKDLRLREPGKPIERDMSGDQTHHYQIELAAGQYLRVVVTQRGIDIVVAVFAPDGNKIAEIDSPNGTRGQEIVSLIAGSSGGFRLEVRSLVKNAPSGRYDVKIEELRVATAQDASRISAERAFAEGRKLQAKGTTESKRKAIEKYEESLPHWEASEDRAGEASTLENIGEIYRSQGEMRKALDYFSRALSLFRALPDRGREAKAHFEVGWVYLGLGEMQMALDHYSQSLSLYRVVADRAEEATILRAIGVLYVALGEYQKAFDYYDQSLLSWRAINNPSGEAQTFVNIGKLYNLLGDSQKALESYKQALALWQAVKSRGGQSIAFTEIGKVYDAMGDGRKALEFFQQSLQIVRTLDDPRRLAFALWEIGRVYPALGEKQKALDYLNQALALLRTVDSRRDEAGALDEIGKVYQSLGEYQKALESFSQALLLLQTLGYRRGEAAMLFRIASLERDRGHLTEARTRIEESLKILESVRTKVFSQESRASYFASVQSNYEVYIDLLMQLHKQNPSEGHVETGLQASERARARSLIESLIEARAEIRQGVNSSLLERERSLQHELNAKADEQARVLNSKHTEQQAAAIRKEVEAITTQYQQTLAQIRVASPRYAALTQPQPLDPREIQQLLDPDTLLLEYALGNERSYLWAVSPTSITSFELPKRAEIEASARRVYDLLTARHLVLDESGQQRQARIAKADAKYQIAAAGLSEMLLGPAASLLGTRRLLIVADGALQYVPFVALPKPQPIDEGRKATATKDKIHSPLILDHEIISLPSASVLAVLRRENAGRKPVIGAVAVLADPVFDKDDDRVKAQAKAQAEAKAKNEASGSREHYAAGDLQRAMREVGATDGGGSIPRLPFSREEAEAIVASAPAGSWMKALNFKANLETATSGKLGTYRVVHFATHGLLNAEHPELSGVVLSLVDEQGRPRDGFLRSHEIYNLELPVELVVLSACQTGLGQDIKGEGLVGLVRAFMYAGAPRVVASLWKVNDLATARMMGHFYQAMLKEGMRPAEALRRAQITMWKQKRWQAPYYWAGFVIQGEWK